MSPLASVNKDCTDIASSPFPYFIFVLILCSCSQLPSLFLILRPKVPHETTISELINIVPSASGLIHPLLYLCCSRQFCGGCQQCNHLFFFPSLNQGVKLKRRALICTCITWCAMFSLSHCYQVMCVLKHDWITRCICISELIKIQSKVRVAGVSMDWGVEQSLVKILDPKLHLMLCYQCIK